MCLLKTTTVPVIVKSLGTIKKATYKRLTSIYEIQKKLPFAELLIFLGKYYTIWPRNNTQKRQQKYKYIEYI